MGDFGNNDDVFGFLELSNDGEGENDNSNDGGLVLENGPSKDAVIFCIDCANFSTISQGMSSFTSV